MGEQLDIFGPPAIQAETVRDAPANVRPSIDQRWAEFHAANPHVLDELLRLARERLARGETRIAIKALWEELRSWLQVTGDTYKLNNDFTAPASRALIAIAPEFAGVIELRRRKNDD